MAVAVLISVGLARSISMSEPGPVASPSLTPPVPPGSHPPADQGVTTVGGPTSGGSPVVDTSQSVLRPPASATGKTWAEGDDCAGLADSGFIARCGTAGPLVWLVQSRPPGQGLGFEARVLRRIGKDQVEVVLEAVDGAGVKFGDVRVAVADIAGDDSRNIVFAFYRLGPGEVLSVDLVEAPGVVGVHRDYPYGSARVAAGRLDGWATAAKGATYASTLVHEVIGRRDQRWEVVIKETSPSAAVYPRDFPDPFLLRVGPTFYGYATNASGANVPLIRSPDMHTWTRLVDALPQLPAWSAPGRVWAPAVLARPGGYVLYYTTRDRASGQQCISQAFSSTPEGPFQDPSTGPLVCQVERGGSIDPGTFVDQDGSAWLSWKSNGVAGETSLLWSQPLSSDGRSLQGTPTVLLTQDQVWELPLVEGPAMIRDGDRYYLFYVAGPWQTADYAIGYATCSTPAGPCVKEQDARVLVSKGMLAGPGGPAFVDDAQGRRWMGFHAWGSTEVGYPMGRRMLYLVPVDFGSGRPVLDMTALSP